MFNKYIVHKPKQSGYYDEKEKYSDEFIAFGNGQVGANSTTYGIAGSHGQGYQPDDLSFY